MAWSLWACSYCTSLLVIEDSHFFKDHRHSGEGSQCNQNKQVSSIVSCDVINIPWLDLDFLLNALHKYRRAPLHYGHQNKFTSPWVQLIAQVKSVLRSWISKEQRDGLGQSEVNALLLFETDYKYGSPVHGNTDCGTSNLKDGNWFEPQVINRFAWDSAYKKASLKC